MFRFMFVIMALATLLSGCAPTKKMFGVSEPNIAEIKPGVARSDVDKILGERLWHVGVAEGLIYDIYQFESEQDAQPILGVVGIGLDIFSFGALDFQHHPRDITPAKQVAVAYDVQGRVTFVSKAWIVTTVGPCRRQRSRLLADSGIPVDARPEPMPGLSSDSAALTSQLGIYFWISSETITVDGHEYKESVVSLPPGRHEVTYYSGAVADVELFPGRFYRLNSENFAGFARARRFYFIEDVDSREVLHCVPP
jgi:hypothetical protein